MARPGRPSGIPLTFEQRMHLSRKLQGRPQSPELRAHRSRVARERQIWKNFRGGDYAETLWSSLQPAGFVREHFVQHGPSRGQAYHLDFAHIEAKVNIELDGPTHHLYSTEENDRARDTFLREQGWRIIRVKHA